MLKEILKTWTALLFLWYTQAMNTTKLLIEEIQTLPSAYIGEIMDFVAYLKRKQLKDTAAMEKAAALAQDEYRSNKELTAFSVLDGENFYETR
jgi:hypothetical protein